MMGCELVAVGASWGGLHALEVVLGALPAGFGAPIVVAQHRSPEANQALLGTLLDRAGPLAVRDAEDKDELRPGEVLLAPADYHLLVEPGAVALSVDAPVHFSRPSVDVLLESAAEAYGPSAVGVVLTGANDDGAAGLAAIAAHGGLALVQDPDEAERDEMPRAALSAVPAARRLALGEIGPRLAELAEVPRSSKAGAP